MSGHMNYPKELTSTYEIYEQIGEGGGGTVYRALHKRLQKTVVLKKIIGNYTNIQDCRTEVDILKNLRNSYLPQVLDFIESPEGIYTVMDFIPGKSLKQMTDEGHKFKEKEVLKYARQLCEALDYLHSQNPPIIHGDIKPANIMVTPEGNVCLIDFNISGFLEGKGAQAFGYTPGFSSPEQAEGYEAICRRLAEQTAAVTNDPDKKTEILRQDDDKTVMLSQDDDKTVMLSQDNDKTVMLSQDDDKTVLLSQDGNSTDLSVQDEDKTMLLFQNEDSDKTALLFQSKQEDRKQKEQKQPVQPLSESQIAAIGEGIIIDKRSDVFSLGATLYTLLTGKILNVQVMNVELPEISDGFWIVLSKALERNPEKRYPDAGKMLQALWQVHKKSRRYRSLLYRQQIVSMLIILLIAAGVFFIIEGRRVMESERQDSYFELVAQMEDGAQSGMGQEEFEQLYTTATEMYPAYFDAYYEMAYYLFQNGEYEALVQYVEELNRMPLDKNDELRGSTYYLYGECLFRLEDYEKAVNGYRTSLMYQQENPSVYRDYAISLVYLDRVEDASEVLDEAILAGMDQVDVYMVSGEIERINGNYQEALANIKNVSEEAEDEYLLQRAFVMGSRTYEDMHTDEALLQDVEWLQEGIARLSMSNRLLLYERLAQDYITLGENMSENGYYAAAVDVFRQIAESGWDTYKTYNNAVILCMRMDDLEQAEQWASEMQNHYPEHYVTYVRLAYLELQKQNQKENSDRDYAAFDAYYQEAKERYEDQVSGNVTDAEMQQLEVSWQQVADGGWFE